MIEDLRVIPGYEAYFVSKSGTIFNRVSGEEVTQYLLNGYAIIDAFYGSRTETLPVHRAVALAWVTNLDPISSTMVNHVDGNTLNNWFENLEWVTCSENNYHAVNTGLRSDAIGCHVRDFQTGNVHRFSSMAQAAEFMGLSKDTGINQLLPKKFGALVAGRFEVRQEDDPTPWFYESRTELVSARYQVTVSDENGNKREIYSTGELLKSYQLYGSPSKAIPELANYAKSLHPDKTFEVVDSYAVGRNRVARKTAASVRSPVLATNGDQCLEFSSLSKCASHFNVDRSSVQSRLDTDKTLDGWNFRSCLSD